MSADCPTTCRNPESEEPGKAHDPRRRLGRSGEDHAARHLERLGFLVLARNQRTRFGEIDLIAFDGRTLVFAEVKTRRCRAQSRGPARSPSATPRPLDSLRPPQRARIRRLAHAWLSSPGVERPRAQEIRFDAIGVVLDGRDRLTSLEHLEAAW